MPGRNFIQSVARTTRRLYTTKSQLNMSGSNARVLSIQSHVVSGYVGNRSAVFPMQLLGIEVDFINSVQFSNHTGYKCFKGQILTENDLAQLIDGLSENGIDTYSHLLTGYIGSESFLKRILLVLEHLKKKNPNLIYVCDPVMGDNGKLYVPEELIPIYRDTVIKLANILTPNLFELEILSGITIKGENDVWNAIENLHNKGVTTVVISSVNIPDKSNNLSIFASSREGDAKKKYSMQIEKLPMAFTGSGDLFAALILSWLHKTNNNLKESLENTIATLQAVLKRTIDARKNGDTSVQSTELKLLQSKRDIEEPNVIIKANIVC